jgi:hypothetical protein
LKIPNASNEKGNGYGGSLSFLGVFIEKIDHGDTEGTELHGEKGGEQGAEGKTT